MSFFDYFRKRPKSASLAKDRLSIIVARERAGTRTGAPTICRSSSRSCSRSSRVTRRSTSSNVTVNLDRHGGSEVLELNIVLDGAKAKPDVAKMTTATPAASS